MQLPKSIKQFKGKEAKIKYFCAIFIVLILFFYGAIVTHFYCEVFKNLHKYTGMLDPVLKVILMTLIILVGATILD